MLLALLTLAMDLHQPRIPLHFEPNQGQVPGETEWIAKAPGATLYIKSTAIAFATADPGKKPRIMSFVGANPVKGEGVDPTGGSSNYFTGRDEKKWHSGVPHYEKVRYKNLYKGIDLVYYATPDRRIEYDLEVAPGADLNQVELSFIGFDGIEVDERGDLNLYAGTHTIKQHRPRVFQAGRDIACSYRILPRDRVKLKVALYDEGLPITVDPVLDFATYLGGPGDDSLGLAVVDSAGFIYVAGATQTPSSPSLNPFQQANLVPISAFVVKFTPAADRIVFFTTFQSSGFGGAATVNLDGLGNIFLSGNTASPDFPVKNGFQMNYTAARGAGFVLKLAPDGRTLLWSSFYSGSYYDILNGAVIDPNGDLIIDGNAFSKDVPMVNAFQPGFGGGQADCFFAKVSNGGKLIFSSYFGGEEIDYCDSLSVDRLGDIWLAAQSYSPDLPLRNPIQTTLGLRNGLSTPVLAEFSNDGQQLKYSTFLGGGGTGAIEAVAFNSKNEILLVGAAFYGQFQVVNAYQSATPADISVIVMKLDPTGQQVLASSFLSGSGRSSSQAIAVGSDDTVYVSGIASSSDFPILDSLQPSRDDVSFTNGLAFVTRFTSDLKALVYSTLFGGSSAQGCCSMSLDSQDRVYITGFTASDDLPIKNAYQAIYAGDYDGFLARISNNTVLTQNPVTATPGQIQIRYVQGGQSPAPQMVQVAGAAGTYTASADAAWVTIVPSSGTIPGTLQIGASILAPGKYSSNVTITPSSGAPLTVPVILNVLLPAPVLTSVEPPSVEIGSDDTLVTFHGSGFTPQTTLLLGAGPYSPAATFVDSQTLQVTMPWESFASAGTYQFSVSNPGSDVSKTVVLSVGGISPAIASAVNAASLVQGPIAPGELLTITGSNFGPTSQFSVTIGGIPAAIIQNPGSNQVTTLVPSIGLFASSASVVIQSGALTSAPLILPLAPTAPGLFTADGSGKGLALIQGTASPGSTVTLFGTGVADLTQTFTATINGASAAVGSVSAVPNQPGQFQLTLTIPAIVPSRSKSWPATIAISVGGRGSQPGVTLAIDQEVQQ